MITRPIFRFHYAITCGGFYGCGRARGAVTFPRMHRGVQQRLRAVTGRAAAAGSTARNTTERLSHLAKKLEHHARIERVIEAQRKRKLRHG